MAIPINKFQLPFGFLGLGIPTLGFFAGGWNVSFTFSNNIDKLSFASGTFSLLSSTLSISKKDIGGISDKKNVFFVGGAGSTNGSGVNTISQLPVSTLTNTTLASTLSTSRSFVFTANTDSIGFVLGGSDVIASATALSSIDEFNFSSKTNSLSSASLAETRSTGGVVNSVQTSAFSYIISGYPTGNVTSSCMKFNLSSKASNIIATGASSSQPSSYGSCHSSSYGYKFRPPGYSIKVNFSNDTFSTPSNPSSAYIGQAILFDLTYGYIGGYYNGSVYTNLVQKLDMTTDTYSATSSMSNAGIDMSQAQNVW